MKRRDAWKIGIGAGLAWLEGCSGEAGGGPYEVNEVPLAEVSAALQKSLTTSTALVQSYLNRIQTIDKTLHSVIEVNPDALSVAADLDRERKAGRVHGPLHGIPILIKDNIDTKDRMKTTAGSLAMMDAPQPEDSGVIRRLRAEGVVILGKTNLSEWANLRSSRSSSGWSSRGGQTLNPYALDRSPSGSSSGTGSAVAASLCAAGVGTETDGSIVSPSSVAGLVGIKPTVGLVSGLGIIPISHTQDTAGPMARSVRDAAMLLGGMVEGPHAESNYQRFLNPNALRGARIGVVRDLFGSNPAVTAIAESALELMKKAGAEIIDPVSIGDSSNYGDEELLVMLYEIKSDMNAYLARRGGPMKSMADLIAFNEREKTKVMPYFGQEWFLKAQQKGDLTTPEYLAARAKCERLSRAEGIDATCAKHGLDALFSPTDHPAWPIDWLNGDHFTGNSSTPAAVAGYPHVTVPAGDVHGLPVGISFFGKAWAEPQLIALAYAFENERKARRPPRYLPTVDYRS